MPVIRGIVYSQIRRRPNHRTPAEPSAAEFSGKHLVSYVLYLQEQGKSASTVKTDLSAIRFFHDKMSYPRYTLPDNEELGVATDRAINAMQQFILRHRDAICAPIVPGRRITFHGLRHTYAAEKYTSLVSGGMTPLDAHFTVSRLLGYERPDVTNIYLASVAAKGGNHSCRVNQANPKPHVAERTKAASIAARTANGSHANIQWLPRQLSSLHGSQRLFRRGLESPSIYRHTYASMLLEQEINPKIVQKLLGHRDVSTTLGIYTHVVPEVFAGVAAAVDTASQQLMDGTYTPKRSAEAVRAQLQQIDPMLPEDMTVNLKSL